MMAIEVWRTVVTDNDNDLKEISSNFALTASASLALKGGRITIWGSNRQGLHYDLIPEPNSPHPHPGFGVRAIRFPETSRPLPDPDLQATSIHGGMGHHFILLANDGSAWVAGLQPYGSVGERSPSIDCPWTGMGVVGWATIDFHAATRCTPSPPLLRYDWLRPAVITVASMVSIRKI